MTPSVAVKLNPHPHKIFTKNIITKLEENKKLSMQLAHKYMTNEGAANILKQDYSPYYKNTSNSAQIALSS